MANSTDETAGSPQEVIMYTTTWCPSCKMAKRYLNAHDIPYQEIDIEVVPGAAAQVQAWARGYKTVPTFRIGDSVVVDWDQGEVVTALKQAGYQV